MPELETEARQGRRGHRGRRRWRRATGRAAVGALALAWLLGTASASAAPSVGGAPPAVAVNPSNDQQYVFWRGTTGRVQQATYAGGWRGPWQRGWPSSSAPAVAAGDDGQTYVFWRGVDSNIYEAWWAHGRWHGPVDMGWKSASIPAVAVNPINNRQYVFWLDASGYIHEAFYDSRWHGPLRTRWASVSAPAVAVGDDGHIYVFWQAANGHIAEAWWTGWWRGPVDKGWPSSSAPAVAVNPRNDHQYVFWRAGDGHIALARYDSRWRGPTDQGWPSLSAPAVAVSDRGFVYVFWRGAGGAIQEAWWTGRWRGPVAKGWLVHSPQLLGCLARGSSLVYDGVRGSRLIALTFDDGPTAYTARLLSVLEREHAPATFFQIGEQLGAYGTTLDSRMLADGDMIGDHSWGHPTLTGAGSLAAREISQTAAAIRAATGGFTPCLFRTPGGSSSPALISQARSMGFLTIKWDIDPRDWELPGVNAIYQNVIDHAHGGAIVIQHDGGGDRTQTLAALPREIDALRSRGYRLVTVSEMLSLPLLNG